MLCVGRAIELRKDFLQGIRAVERQLPIIKHYKIECRPDRVRGLLEFSDAQSQ